MPAFCKNIIDGCRHYSLVISIGDNGIPPSIDAVDSVSRKATTTIQEIIPLLNDFILANFLSPFPNGLTNNRCVNVTIHFIAIIR